VSALGHYLENEGISTVAISLIRPQTEKTKPPRALWVPFELGRPFGAPGDPAFQKQVLLAALRMLEWDNGPVVIDDFPNEDPRSAPDPGWRAPYTPAVVTTGGPESLAAQLEAEILLLRGRHELWVSKYSRTTVGLSGLPMEECTRYVADWLRGKAPPSPFEHFSAPLMLRFAVDDVKAFCLEAAATTSGKPSSRQLGDWLWNKTATGAAIQALRVALQASEDERLKLIVSNFMVPATRVPPG
jgi:hypothetical protein